jgi:hypothetical protein
MKMKMKKLLAMALLAGTFTLTGCALDPGNIGQNLFSRGEEEPEEDSDRDTDRDDEDDEDSDRDRHKKKDKDKDKDKDKEADAETLLQEFLDDEIEATQTLEDGSERTFKYSDLPHDEDDWESYYYNDNSFVDLDNDGEDELILWGPYGGMYLDARDGGVYVLTEGHGTAGELWYTEHEGDIYIVHADVSHAGRQIHNLDRYENGEIVESFDLSAEYWENTFDTYDRDSDFTYRGEKVTMEEYEALCKEYLGYKTKVENAQYWGEYAAETFDHTREKTVNDGSEEFYAKLDACLGDYYYPEDSDGREGTLTIAAGDGTEYEIDDNYAGGGYRFLAFSSNIEYFLGDDICLKYPEMVFADENEDPIFSYYVIICHPYFVEVYSADSNYENLEYLYTGWVKY